LTVLGVSTAEQVDRTDDQVNRLISGPISFGNIESSFWCFIEVVYVCYSDDFCRSL